MSSRKLKTINIVILSIVYLMASCLGSMSFAITSDTGYAADFARTVLLTISHKNVIIEKTKYS